MEKLIELLNEYDEDWRIGRFGLYKWEEYETMEEYIISKKFGFIKWLVDNDKIDYKKLHGEEWYIPLVDMIKFDGSKRLEVLLMLSSIQDEPIEFLCSILK